MNPHLLPPAGYFPDPAKPGYLRWWTGTEWVGRSHRSSEDFDVYSQVWNRLYDVVGDSFDPSRKDLTKLMFRCAVASPEPAWLELVASSEWARNANVANADAVVAQWAGMSNLGSSSGRAVAILPSHQDEVRETRSYPGWDSWLGEWAYDLVIHQTLARYRGGIEGLQVSKSFANLWGIQVGVRGVVILVARFGGLASALTNIPSGGMALWTAEPWDRIQSIRINDDGQERLNKAAIAAFGVFAVNSKVPVVSLSIDLPNSTVYFEVDGWLQAWQAVADQLTKANPSLHAKIRIGTPQEAKLPAAEHSGVADEFERLADLFSKGLLTDDEFRQAKQRLLNP